MTFPNAILLKNKTLQLKTTQNPPSKPNLPSQPNRVRPLLCICCIQNVQNRGIVLLRLTPPTVDTFGMNVGSRTEVLRECSVVEPQRVRKKNLCGNKNVFEEKEEKVEFWEKRENVFKWGFFVELLGKNCVFWKFRTCC